MKTLRLILGDQLNINHSWYRRCDADVIYVMMEIRSETAYVLHHAQKVLAIFAAMRDFNATLKQAGHRTVYFKIDDARNQHHFADNVQAVVQALAIERLEYQLPDEYRVDQTLKALAAQLNIETVAVDSEHFIAPRETARQFFRQKKWLMENYYRLLRSKHDVLMQQGKPIGGQWNFDHANRKAWRGTPAAPKDARPAHDHSAIYASLTAQKITFFGAPHASDCQWPLNRQEALAQLATFVHDALPHFGDYQDAMDHRHSRLFHSLLSFALNTKMLSPMEVIRAAEEAYHAGHAPIAAVEGFIRQILGWREFVRGYYWANMPALATQNFFNHHAALPDWLWTANTNMACLRSAIGQSLEEAYAHHIQRLMIIGNFALLAGLNPAQVHAWYLGVYIDAFEWVELPNTLGMSQFADGGQLATKPYVSSANYIDKMSDYCSGCPYDKKKKTGDKACPFNSLYWHFFSRHADKLKHNPRLAIVYKQLARLDAHELSLIAQQAEHYLQHIETL